jgi:hypothetical protein
MAMAKRVEGNPLADDVKKAKDKINEGARAVGTAASRLAKRIEEKHPEVFGKAEEDWNQTIHEIDDLDTEFMTEEQAVDRLRRKFESVRVMQIGPNGVLTDVSDKVNPSDLRPEHIAGVQTEDGRTFPLGRTPQNREAALRFLQDIMPGLRLSTGTSAKDSTSNSIRRMEAALAEGDKILEHWKK